MIYLDYNATTPVAREVLDAMLPYFTDKFGNAASRTHLAGWEAAEGVEQARQQVAGLLGCEPAEIVFTGGATEAINLALKGAFDAAAKSQGRKHIITVQTEHKAVLDSCRYLQEVRGAEVTYLGVDKQGHIDLQELAAAIRPDTLLVAVMYVNNETGLINPVKEVGEICRKHGVLFFCDAVQAVGKVPVVPAELGVDMLAFSAHKIYGPKGVGALYIKNNTPLCEQMSGGGHERKRRSGTLNVPGIVGLGQAAGLAAQHLPQEVQRIKKLRDRLEERLRNELDEVYINGDAQNRVAQVSNLLIKNIVAEDLLLALSTHVAISAGSACTAAEVLPSHVLTAMHLPAEDALASVRISLGRPTTEEEIDRAAGRIIAAVKQLRGA